MSPQHAQQSVEASTPAPDPEADPAPDRFVRQADLFDRTRLDRAVVVGVGAVGRQLALMLAGMGVPRLRLVDHDVVELTNVTTQGYPHADLGRRKVASLADTLAALSPDVEVAVTRRRWAPSAVPLEGRVAVCACVDSIDVRRRLWEDVGGVGGPHCVLFLDGRVLGEQLRVLAAAADQPHSGGYAGSLFHASESEPGRCTARMTVYSAAVCAGLMAHQLARWSRGERVDPDVVVNLAAGDMGPAHIGLAP